MIEQQEVHNVSYDISVAAHSVGLTPSRSLPLHPHEKISALKRTIQYISTAKLPIPSLYKFYQSQTMLKIQARLTPRVLVVDDNRLIAWTAAMAFSRNGWEAHMAYNGKQALEVLEKHTFDLILVDMRMPVMEGPETTTRIRETQKDLPSTWPRCVVIGMIASDDFTELTLRQGAACGMDRYIIKPVLLHVKMLTKLFSERLSKPPLTQFRSKCIERPLYSRYEEIKELFGKVTINHHEIDDASVMSTGNLLRGYEGTKGDEKIAWLLQRQVNEEQQHAAEQVNQLRDIVRTMEKDLEEGDAKEKVRTQQPESSTALQRIEKWRQEMQQELADYKAKNENLTKKVTNLERINKQLKEDISDMVMKRSHSNVAKRFHSRAEISRTILEMRENQAMAMEDDLARRSYHNYRNQSEETQAQGAGGASSWFAGPLNDLRLFVTKYDYSKLAELKPILENIYTREKQWWELSQDTFDLKSYLLKVQQSAIWTEKYVNQMTQTNSTPPSTASFYQSPSFNATKELVNQLINFDRPSSAETGVADDRSVTPPYVATQYVSSEKLSHSRSVQDVLPHLRHRETIIDQCREREAQLRRNLEKTVLKLYSDSRRMIGRHSLMEKVEVLPPPPSFGDKQRYLHGNYEKSDVGGTDPAGMFRTLESVSEFITVFGTLVTQTVTAQQAALNSNGYSSFRSVKAPANNNESKTQTTQLERSGEKDVGTASFGETLPRSESLGQVPQEAERRAAAQRMLISVVESADTVIRDNTTKASNNNNSNEAVPHDDTLSDPAHASALKACALHMYTAMDNNNGTTVLTHEVTNSDTINGVSVLYGVPQEAVYELNPSLQQLKPTEQISKTEIQEVQIPVMDTNTISEVVKKVHTSAIDKLARIAHEIATTRSKKRKQEKAIKLEAARQQLSNVENMKNFIDQEAALERSKSFVGKSLGPRPTLIAHLQPNEAIAEIAERYGVTEKEIVFMTDTDLEIPLTAKVLEKLLAIMSEIVISRLHMLPIIGVLETLALEAYGIVESSGPRFLYAVQSHDSLEILTDTFCVDIETLRVHNPFMGFDQTGLLVDTPYLYIPVTGEALLQVKSQLRGHTDKNLFDALGPCNAEMLDLALNTIRIPEKPVVQVQSIILVQHHLVHAGDSVQSLAALYRISIRELYSTNPFLRGTSAEEELSAHMTHLFVPMYQSTLRSVVTMDRNTYLLQHTDSGSAGPLPSDVERRYFAWDTVLAKVFEVLDRHPMLPASVSIQHALLNGETTNEVLSFYGSTPAGARNVQIKDVPGLKLNVSLQDFVDCVRSHVREIEESTLVNSNALLFKWKSALSLLTSRLQVIPPETKRNTDPLGDSGYAKMMNQRDDKQMRSVVNAVMAKSSALSAHDISALQKERDVLTRLVAMFLVILPSYEIHTLVRKLRRRGMLDEVQKLHNLLASSQGGSGHGMRLLSASAQRNASQSANNSKWSNTLLGDHTATSGKSGYTPRSVQYVMQEDGGAIKHVVPDDLTLAGKGPKSSAGDNLMSSGANFEVTENQVEVKRPHTTHYIVKPIKRSVDYSNLSVLPTVVYKARQPKPPTSPSSTTKGAAVPPPPPPPLPPKSPTKPAPYVKQLDMASSRNNAEPLREELQTHQEQRPTTVAHSSFRRNPQHPNLPPPPPPIPRVDSLSKQRTTTTRGGNGTSNRVTINPGDSGGAANKEYVLPNVSTEMNRRQHMLNIMSGSNKL